MGLTSLPLSLRNSIFVILQPGVVVGLVPYLLVRSSFADTFAHGFLPHHYIGMLLLVFGASVLLHCVIRFALDGRGTLSPIDPTIQLVTSGLYRYSRNPMYVGVMLILIGEVVFLQSADLLLYSVVIFILFSLFIRYHEEPRTRL
jgi:protein-S-isoprenylcysteine O-methyltransferase Ste14